MGRGNVGCPACLACQKGGDPVIGRQPSSVEFDGLAEDDGRSCPPDSDSDEGDLDSLTGSCLARRASMRKLVLALELIPEIDALLPSDFRSGDGLVGRGDI